MKKKSKDKELAYLERIVKNKYKTAYPRSTCPNSIEWCDRCKECYNKVCEHVSEMFNYVKKDRWKKGDAQKIINVNKNIYRCDPEFDNEKFYEDIHTLIIIINKCVNYNRFKKDETTNLLHLTFLEDLISELYDMIDLYFWRSVDPYSLDIGIGICKNVLKTKLRYLNLICLEIYIILVFFEHRIVQFHKQLYYVARDNTK